MIRITVNGHARAQASMATSRRAMALLVVLVLVMLAAYSAYNFMFTMESQYRDARMFEEQLGSRQAAISGVEIAAALLELPPERREKLGGINDNPAWFRDRSTEITTASAAQLETPSGWRFTIVSPSGSGKAPPNESSGLTLSAASSADSSLSLLSFGLENESAKIPIPALMQWDQQSPGYARRVLANLPAAQEQTVDAMLSLLGVNSRRSIPGTIDGSTSAGRRQPRSRQLELFQSIWLGGDLNCNYRWDPLDEAWAQRTMLAGEGAAPSDIRGSSASMSIEQPVEAVAQIAWQRYLTWHSGHRNQTFTGQPRINLNEPDLRLLHQQLLQVWPAEWADFVVLFRQYGSVAGGRSADEQTASSNPPNFAIPGRRILTSPLELIGSVVEINDTSSGSPNSGSSSGNGGTSGSKSSKRRVRSPFLAENAVGDNYLVKLLDEVTVQANPVVQHRIDINQAPLVVLLSVPGMDRQTAEAIVQGRLQRETRSSESGLPTTTAWLLQQGIVDLSRFIQLEPFLTARSDVYSCQAIGYRDMRSAVYRCTVTIDATQTPAKLRNLQTWHHWDRGFDIQAFATTSSNSSRTGSSTPDNSIR